MLQPEDDLVTLPPIPLATGSWVDTSSGLEAVNSVAVVVRTKSGIQVEMPLTWRHGAWWAPKA